MQRDSDTPHDGIADALTGDSAYERLRIRRLPYFKQPLTTKLGIQTALLFGLAALFPLYVAFPESSAAYLSSADPTAASPKVVVLGVFGGSMELVGAMALVVAGWVRIREAPVSERLAARLINAEAFGSFVGLTTGALAITLTVGLSVLGIGGEPLVEAYVDVMDGTNPFADSGTGVSVRALSVAAFVAACLLAVVRRYLLARLPETAN
jgi:hypothetical protein